MWHPHVYTTATLPQNNSKTVFYWMTKKSIFRNLQKSTLALIENLNTVIGEQVHYAFLSLNNKETHFFVLPLAEHCQASPIYKQAYS